MLHLIFTSKKSFNIIRYNIFNISIQTNNLYYVFSYINIIYYLCKNEIAMSFRRDILDQISRKKKGVVFSFKDLTFPAGKLANVAVVLSELCKKGELNRLEKGAYFKPASSSGLFTHPDLSQEALVKYLTAKYDGYVTGDRAYSQFGLTNAPCAKVSIATRKNVRRTNFHGLEVDFVKAYVGHIRSSEELYCVHILDAIKDIKSIFGKTEQEIYDVLKINHIGKLSSGHKIKLINMAQNYPPRVKKILGDIFEDLHEYSLRDKVTQGLYPTTRYSLNYAPASTPSLT